MIEPAQSVNGPLNDENVGKDPLDTLAIIFGAMRSGTTSLFTWLSQHPQICACRHLEPGFFSNDWVWARGIEWYRKLWPWQPGKHQVALEKSTNYSNVALYPHTAQRIYATAPNARLIFIMRNPIERVESHYTLDRANGWVESRGSLPEGRFGDVIERSKYAKQLEPYYELFASENILLLRFEDLGSEPEELMKIVCQFLHLDTSHVFHSLHSKHAANDGRRPGELGHLVYRFRVYVPFWRAMTRRLRPAYANIARNLLSRRGASNCELSKNQRTLVLDELRDDLRRLQGEYGFDISMWGIEV